MQREEDGGQSFRNVVVPLSCGENGMGFGVIISKNLSSQLQEGWALIFEVVNGKMEKAWWRANLERVASTIHDTLGKQFVVVGSGEGSEFCVGADRKLFMGAQSIYVHGGKRGESTSSLS